MYMNMYNRARESLRRNRRGKKDEDIQRERSENPGKEDKKKMRITRENVPRKRRGEKKKEEKWEYPERTFGENEGEKRKTKKKNEMTQRDRSEKPSACGMKTRLWKKEREW
jgi:hypothetical protein